jgi:hypothetical protein
MLHFSSYRCYFEKTCLLNLLLRLLCQDDVMACCHGVRHATQG